MAIISFSAQLGNPNSTFPKSLILSLSGVGLDVLTLGTNTKFVVYNPVPPSSLTGTQFILSAYPDTTVRIDTAYSGQTLGIVYNNNDSSLFTLVSAVSGVVNQPLVSNDTGSTTYPEWRRLYNLMND
jgi:hypothetical protein